MVSLKVVPWAVSMVEMTAVLLAPYLVGQKAASTVASTVAMKAVDLVVLCR